MDENELSKGPQMLDDLFNVYDYTESFTEVDEKKKEKINSQDLTSEGPFHETPKAPEVKKKSSEDLKQKEIPPVFQEIIPTQKKKGRPPIMNNSQKKKEQVMIPLHKPPFPEILPTQAPTIPDKNITQQFLKPKKRF